MAHHTMRGSVVVESQADFDAWLAQQPTFAETQSVPPGDPTAGQAMYAVCSACHGLQGEGNPETHAPRLAGQQGWYIRKQLAHFKGGMRGDSPDDDYGKQMAPMAGVLADAAAVNNVIAYLQTLKPETPAATITGDLEHGASMYTVCANCHDNDGSGIWAQNAPRVAGINDWYLATQLKNFKQGVRGSHHDDADGRQMAFMARTLADDQAINDLVAYINTLEPSAQ